jgi:hypothetical protein
MSNQKDVLAPATSAPMETFGYNASVRRTSYSLLCSLPLLVGYEVLIRLGQGGEPQVINGADFWIKTMLAALGAWGVLGLSVVVIAFSIFQIYRDTKLGVQFRKNYFIGMLAESLAYAVVLPIVVSLGMRVFRLATGGLGVNGVTDFAMCLGAGFYEELFFRFLLVGVTFSLLSKAYAPKNPRGLKLLVFVLAAAMFSAVHYIGALGDAFTLESFFFRFGFGLMLGVVYLYRGFGIAAWSHAMFDVMVVFKLVG